MLVFPFSISFLEFPQKAWKAWWSKSGQRAWSLESDLAQPRYVSNLSILNFMHHVFYLNRLEIPRVDQCKYLGIMISIKNCDIDIKRQLRKFYANINILKNCFHRSLLWWTCSFETSMYFCIRECIYNWWWWDVCSVYIVY